MKLMKKKKFKIKIVFLPLLAVAVALVRVVKEFKGMVFLSNKYLLLFLVAIASVLYLDGVPFAQQHIPYIPWDLSYANLMNFASLFLAWFFSLHQQLIAAEYKQGANNLVITKETIIALILGILVFLLAFLDWNSYSVNAYATTLILTFLVMQTAISRMIIMVKAHTRNIQGRHFTQR